jgi:hypothetical protein
LLADKVVAAVHSAFTNTLACLKEIKVINSTIVVHLLIKLRTDYWHYIGFHVVEAKNAKDA